MADFGKAHNLSKTPRTTDVKINEKVEFESLLLSDPVLIGLRKAGFERPSPIQLKAIPLGRCGLDLIVQAKSGTGKTCVFAVVALESISLDISSTQVLVVAPTREIAVQIWEVINSLGSSMPKLRCYTFIGGMPVAEDKAKLKKCHIAVGTPGRLRQLIEEQALNTESIRLFVLDEADKLMEQGFQETINWIYSSLAENKQMLALSATYPEILAQHLTVYMRNPTFVRLNTDDPSLLGIRQYYKVVPFSPIQQKAFELKCKALMDLLNAVSFQQCLVFSNYQLRAQSLSDVLNKEGWPATYISGSQDQQDRLVAMAKLKAFKCRILISTDLTSRGIDAANVNLVVNLDIPHDHETYLHRIGRAGRFGTYGAAVTFAALGKETADLKTIQAKAHTTLQLLPDVVPADLAHASGYIDYSDLVTAEPLNADEAASITSDPRLVHPHQPAAVLSHDPAQSHDPEQSYDLAMRGSCDGDQTTKKSMDNAQNGTHSHSSDSQWNKMGAVMKQHESRFSAESPKAETNQQQESGSGDITKFETTSEQEVDNLIDEFQTKLQTEYSKIEEIFDLASGHNIQDSKQTTFLNGIESEISGKSLVFETEVVSHGPELASQLGDPSPSNTGDTHEVEHMLTTGDTLVSDASDIGNKDLPTVESLQKFADCMKFQPDQLSDIILPQLTDIINHQSRPYESYNDILADLTQFKVTGKSNLPAQNTQAPPGASTSVYDNALQKLDKIMENCWVADDVIGTTAASGAASLSTVVGLDPVDNDASELRRVINPVDGNEIAQKEKFAVNQSSYVKPFGAAGDARHVSSEIEIAIHHSVEVPNPDRIIGFAELNAHTGIGKTPNGTQNVPSELPTNTSERRIPNAERSKVTSARQTAAADRRLGKACMKMLSARANTDSESSTSIDVESDTESDEYSYTAEDAQTGDGEDGDQYKVKAGDEDEYDEDEYDEEYDEDQDADDENYDEYCDEEAGDDGYDHVYNEGQSDPTQGQYSQHYAEPHQLVFDQYHTHMWDQGGYNSQNWHGQNHTSYSHQGQWGPEGQQYPGYPGSLPGYGEYTNAAWGPYPHQLWLQCHNILSSIQAMQAAQYSWYCQQHYHYHVQAAKLYQKLHKYQTRKKQQKTSNKKDNIPDMDLIQTTL